SHAFAAGVWFSSHDHFQIVGVLQFPIHFDEEFGRQLERLQAGQDRFFVRDFAWHERVILRQRAKINKDRGYTGTVSITTRAGASPPSQPRAAQSSVLISDGRAFDQNRRDNLKTSQVGKVGLPPLPILPWNGFRWPLG